MECIICYNNFSQLNKCFECDSYICCDGCFNKLKNNACPKCRNDTFKKVKTIPEGDFSFINDNMLSDMLTKTYQAVTNTNNWEMVKDYKVDPKKGFMFSSEVFLLEISNEIDNLRVGHSGASWGFSMQQIAYIAKYGWKQYIDTYPI
jgi:hypothetical protein